MALLGCLILGDLFLIHCKLRPFVQSCVFVIIMKIIKVVISSYWLFIM